MEKQTCTTCIFFHKFTTATGTEICVCRKRSPKLVAVTNNDGTPGTHSCWPRVKEDSWCGDYREKRNE